MKTLGKVISGCLLIAGLIIMMGSAGALDVNQIPFDQATWQMILGLAIFLLGGIGLRVIGE